MKPIRTIIGLFLMLAAVAMGGVPPKPAEFTELLFLKGVA